MDDLISRQALMWSYGAKCCGDCEMCGCSLWSDGYTHICTLIRDAPTVDAVPVVHGEWLSAYEFGMKCGVDGKKLQELKDEAVWKFCSLCDQQVRVRFPYCPNCGARMDLEV